MAGVRKKQIRGGKFQGWFTNALGERQFFTGTRSKTDTLHIAQRLEDEHRQVRLGYREPPSVANQNRDRLISEVVDEYFEWGKAQGGRNGYPWAPSHSRNRERHLAWWCDRLGLEFMGDLSGCLPKVEREIRYLLAQGKAGKTVANYVEALTAFCDWCCERDYLPDDPLKRLRPIDTTPKSRKRALSRLEIKQLLAVCEEHERLLLETALLSGLRANELRQLTRRHLDTEQCGLLLDAAWTKNRKLGFQPLPKLLVDRLLAFSDKNGAQSLSACHYDRPEHGENVPEHALLYVPSHPARSLDILLDKAGIPKETTEGKVDFHALRVTFVTLVIEGGANVKEAQHFARHATPQLTMDVYARVRNERLHQTVESISKNVLD